jgi:hypothetical protein
MGKHKEGWKREGSTMVVVSRAAEPKFRLGQKCTKGGVEELNLLTE